MAKSARVTLRDVADQVGVSTATVSRVLSGLGGARPELTERITSTARRMGYRTDEIARSLRQRRTHSIGLVIPDITNPFFPALVHAIEEELRGSGYGLLLADAQNSPAVERECVAHLVARQIDALLVSPCDQRRSRATVVEASEQVPVVQIDRSAVSSLDSVALDQSRAIRLALEHVAERGRKHPAFVGFEPGASVWAARRRAYLRHVPALDRDGTQRVLETDVLADAGRGAVDTLLSRWPETDALICTSDLIAVTLQLELSRRGVPVPERIAIVGFDDTVLAATTGLTSVAQPLDEIARAARQLAVPAGGRRGDAPRRITVRPRLVARESSR